MSTLRANLSFWATDAPISIGQLDSAESLLVKMYHIFIDLYVNQGLSYKAFCRQAFKGLCAVDINNRSVTQSINKVVAAYSRVYDVLIHHRGKVIEAFMRKSSFDTEAALLLLELCELRSCRGIKASTPDYPDAADYDKLASCANDFDVFATSISGQDLMSFRDGNLTQPLIIKNISRAVFFLSLMMERHYLPRKWKHLAVSKGMLVKSKDNQVPTLRYLQVAAERVKAEQYLADSSSPKYSSRESVYLRLSRAVKTALKSK